MILHHISICILICIQLTTGQSSEKFNVDSNSDAFIGNDLVSNAFLTDESVGALLGKVTELSDRYKKDMTGTVADLQKMIDKDQSLPRLTRGEIIDLLENLTKADPAEIRKKVIKTREEYQRALMLVMPYTPKNTDKFNMEELYTRPPITRIIGAETDEPVSTRKPYIPKRNVQILLQSTAPPPLRATTITNLAKFVNFGLEEVNEPSLPVEKKTNKQDEIKQVETKQVETEIVKPKQLETKAVEVNADIPKTTRRRVKPTRYSNHKYPEETTMSSSNDGIRIVNPPSLVKDSDNMNVDYWHYTQNENKQVAQVKPHRQIRPNTMQSSVYKGFVSTTGKPRVRSTYSTTTSTTPHPLKNIDIPLEMKDVLSGVNFGQMEPLTSQKFSSHYDAAMANFPKEEPVTENVRDLLESIGVLPINGAVPTTLPDISNVANNLSPEMRDLLMTFGLIESSDKKNIEQPYAAPYIQKEYPNEPGSYSQFKPLPDSAPSRQDMEEFLAEYGLVGNSQRSSKILKVEDPPKYLSKVPDINMDMIPESMHAVLEDIGLTQKRAKKLLLDDIQTDNDNTHVFSPDNHYVSEEEIKRLNQLLGTIKKLEKMNRTATIEDLKDLDIDNIKELTNILKQDSSIPLDLKNFGPDPLDFDFGGEKNEVKRQENSTTTTTEKPASSTEETKNPSLAALEESFGGQTGSSSEIVDESLPPPRKTGFYYLLDWNSFLEVGEEGRNKVNIRFSPQAGDASRFLRVTVP